MSTRKIATSTLWQIASQCTMAALSILTVKFTAIGLSKELFGNYNSAYGYLQLFGILADAGLYAIAVRELSRAKEEEKPEVLGALIVLRCITLTLSLILALSIAWSVPAWRGTPLPLGITIAALVPFFTLLAGILRAAFQVRYAMHYVFIAEVLQRIVTAGFMGLFIVLGVRGSTDLSLYHLFLFVGGLGAFVLFGISLAAGRRLITVTPRLEKTHLLALARAAAPFGLAYLCIALVRQMDVTLIALLRPDFELQNAYYGPIVRILDMGFLLPTFLLNSALPILVERLERGEDVRTMVGKILLIILTIGSISSLFAFFWARPITALLTTETFLSVPGYPGSDSALLLQSFPLFLSGLLLFGFYGLLACHAWRRLLIILGCGAALSLALNVALIPRFGFLGASVVAIIVSALLAATLLLASLRLLPVRTTPMMIRGWMLFSVLLGGVLFFAEPFLTSEIRTLGGLAAMALVLPILLFVTGIPRSIAGISLPKDTLPPQVL